MQETPILPASGFFLALAPMQQTQAAELKTKCLP